MAVRVWHQKVWLALNLKAQGYLLSLDVWAMGLRQTGLKGQANQVELFLIHGVYTCDVYTSQLFALVKDPWYSKSATEASLAHSAEPFMDHPFHLLAGPLCLAVNPIPKRNVASARDSKHPYATP